MSRSVHQRPRDLQEQTFRYERKFTVAIQDLPTFRHELKLHPAGFRQAFPPRFVNNVYFDNLDFSNLFENLDGVANRCKMRVRWYGDLWGEISNAFVEYKIKRGLAGTKRRFDLPTFVLAPDSHFGSVFAAAGILSELDFRVRHDLQTSQAVVLNRYCREYYQVGERFRVTLDSEVTSRAGPRFGDVPPESVAVVELKYDPSLESEASSLLQHFPLRVARNSKYVNGLMGDTGSL